MAKTRFLIISGMSGAGKSLVLKVLEDLNYFCIDNLPPALIPQFADLFPQFEKQEKNVALVVDVRVGSFFSELTKILSDLKSNNFEYEMLFLDCSDEKIIQRYKETRRKHPLAVDDRISKGIAQERAILNEAKYYVTNTIDTSNTTDKELRQKIIDLYGVKGKAANFNITVVSFGFKYGLPRDVDIIFDVRFLPNPFYIDTLRDKTGLEKDVGEYIMQWKNTRTFLEKFFDLIEFLVPQYINEGKTQLIIAIGCTGGRHRSVFITELLAEKLESLSYRVRTEHRDIKKQI